MRGQAGGGGGGCADSASLCPQAGVVSGHAAEGQEAGSGWQTPLLWLEAESGHTSGERVCQPGGSSWLLPQAPRSPEAQGPLEGGGVKSRASLPPAGGEARVWALSHPSVHRRALRQDQGPGRERGLQYSEGQDPGVGGRRECVEGGRGLCESLKREGGSPRSRDGRRYTKASRLDEPLSLRKSLSSSLFCSSCLSSWRR